MAKLLEEIDDFKDVLQGWINESLEFQNSIKITVTFLILNPTINST